MSLRTKTEIKNFFVTNAVPLQQNYSDWVDSSVFLNSDNSTTLNSINIEDILDSEVETPAVGYKKIFSNASNSDIISVIHESGRISPISPNHTVSLAIDENFNANYYLMVTKSIVEIKSITVSVIGIGTFDLNVFNVGNEGVLANATQIINTLSFSSVSATDFTLAEPAIISADVGLGQIIGISLNNVSNTFRGVITIEYREV